MFTKITFGTTSQLKHAIIAAGARKCYFLDMPRTRSKDENLASVMAIIEDLKNGHIVSHMYGHYSQLLMGPPHIRVFSNQKCPQEMLSADRWITYLIDKKKLTLDKME